MLFWELWECLTIPIRNHSINLSETFMLICMQKINIISLFFYKILLKNSKLVILGNLGIPGRTHLKWQYHFEEISDVYQQAKNQLHSSCFPWDIANILQNCYFGYFGQSWLHRSKILLTCRKRSYLSAAEEPLQPHVFLEILYRYANFLFWVLWECLDTHTQNGSINL